MKRLFFAVILLAMAVQVQAFESKTVAVVDGRISTTTDYYILGGGDPEYFERQFSSDYYGKGTLGFAQQTLLTNDVTVQEQLEVNAGFGRFETKCGDGSLVLSTDPNTGEAGATFTQNAIGFGGRLNQGIFSGGFDTAGESGFVGLADVQGIGTFAFGAEGRVQVGGILAPTTTERTSIHGRFGPGQFQVQVNILFPKGD
jgi:hypothetical protein